MKFILQNSFWFFVFESLIKIEENFQAQKNPNIKFGFSSHINKVYRFTSNDLQILRDLRLS